MEEDIIYEFRNIVEESRTEDRQDYYIKLRNTLDLLENLLQENKTSKETINILTNKLEKVVDDNNELKTKYENLKIRHNGTKEALRVAEDLERQYSQEASNLEEELDNCIPISVIQNKKKYWEQEHHIAGEHLVVQVLDEILDLKE